jgi:hypothetical protein
MTKEDLEPLRQRYAIDSALFHPSVPESLLTFDAALRFTLAWSEAETIQEDKTRHIAWEIYEEGFTTDCFKELTDDELFEAGYLDEENDPEEIYKWIIETITH